MNEIFVQIIGIGAGLGIALRADMRGELEELLNMGAVWFDARPLGAGSSIGEYKIISNSPVSDYLEVLRSDGAFSRVFEACSGRWLMEQSRTAQIPLYRVGMFTGELQGLLAQVAHGYPKSEVHAGVKIDRVEWNGACFASFAGGKLVAISRNLILSPGAREQLLPELRESLDPNKVFLSSDILSASRSLIGNNISIIGSSHSAAAIVWLLQASRMPGQGLSVIMWSRKPIKYYYASEKEARASGYHFEPEDVCPLSGKVNRFGGIRPPYREALKSAIAGRWLKVKTFSSIQEILASPKIWLSDEVVQATGYKANVIPIHGVHGSAGPLLNEKGHVAVDDAHRVRDLAGNPIPGAFALGLGHQPYASPRLGGEPSYRGPVDGFNVFAGVSADTILKEMLGRI